MAHNESKREKFLSVFKGRTKKSAGQTSSRSVGDEAVRGSTASPSTSGELLRTSSPAEQVSKNPLPMALEQNPTPSPQESIDERKDPYGLKPLAGPTDENADLDPRTPDIVAVHGIDGNAWGTWEHNNEKLWLRDFLPKHVPGARIYSFGYRAEVAFTRGRGDLKGFARSLLEGLNGVRFGEVTSCPSDSWASAQRIAAAPISSTYFYLSQYGRPGCEAGKKSPIP